MVSVQEASRIVFSHLYKPGEHTLPITVAGGTVLAEPIRADRDFPPFHRVAMDGIAIQYEAWKEGKTAFAIEGVQAAGEPQKKLLNSMNCFEVMTGAVLPEGTDTVIRYEDVQVRDGIAQLSIAAVVQGSNIHRQQQDARKEAVLLEPGTLLSPAEIALLAAVGKAEVKVYAFPSTAIISSGDELVAIEDVPQPHQIRRSNVYAIEAAMREMHWAGNRFHLPDDKSALETGLREAVRQHDLIILSGGVSKGKFDFIPEVLEAVGFKKLFHQVSQRPGKPFWFGVSENGKVVFALPGNPVSTYLCFYRYIKPWVIKSMGSGWAGQYAVLAQDFSFAPALTYFLQVTVKNEQGVMKAYPAPGGGSGDFANLKNVTGFLELPVGQTDYQAGTAFPYYPFRS